MSDEEEDTRLEPDGKDNLLKHIKDTDYGNFVVYAEHRYGDKRCYFKILHGLRLQPERHRKLVNKMLSSIDRSERKIINYYLGVFPNDEVFKVFRLYLLENHFDRNLDIYLHKKYKEIEFINQTSRDPRLGATAQGQLSMYFKDFETAKAIDDYSKTEDYRKSGSGGRKKSRKRKLIKSRTSKKRKQIKRQSKKQRNYRNSRRSNKIKKLYTRKKSK